MLPFHSEHQEPWQTRVVGVTRLQRSIMAEGLTPQCPLPYLAPSSGPQSLPAGGEQESCHKETHSFQQKLSGVSPGRRLLLSPSSHGCTLAQAARVGVGLRNHFQGTVDKRGCLPWGTQCLGQATSQDPQGSAESSANSSLEGCLPAPQVPQTHRQGFALRNCSDGFYPHPGERSPRSSSLERNCRL